jgi:putative hydrolases of HD superfamily
MDIKKVVNFIFELNMLKRESHSGWKLAGVAHPDSVAEHTLRAAQIGYILAIMEGADPEKVAAMIMIHDNPETRIGDQHKVSAKYINTSETEKQVMGDQVDLLGEIIAEKWTMYFEEFEERTTKEGIVAKDADWLEQAFQAKEYFDQGYKSTMNWIDNTEKAVETESAKLLIKELCETEFTEWWKDLKKMTYQKLS